MYKYTSLGKVKIQMPTHGHQRWLLLLKEYGVSFEYLPGKKNVVACALSRLGIDDVRIQEEEVLAFLSESEFSSIKFPMHTALIFKEQMKVQGLRKKGLSQPQYSMQHFCSTCPVCLLTKKEHKKLGLLVLRTAESDPWGMVCVDLVSPFTIKTPLKIHSLLALTMIDPATG
jgi:hypothetical protein